MQLYPLQLQLMNNIKQTMKCIEIENAITMRVYPATASETWPQANVHIIDGHIKNCIVDWLILNRMNNNFK